MPANRHQVWRFAMFAWVAMILLPTALVVARWQLGIDRDADMSGVGELVLFLMVLLTVPAGALSFGVLGPAALLIDRMMDGRGSRAVNLLIGAALGVPLLAVFVLGGSLLQWRPDHPFAQNLHESVASGVRYPVRAALFLALFALAGMIVGLGLRVRPLRR